MSKMRPKHLNLSLLCAVISMVLFGLVMLYSASKYNSQIYYGTSLYYLQSQIIGAVLGVFLMTVVYFVDYKVYKKWYIAIYGAGLVLLAMVFLPVIGISRLGSSRWIGIGGFSMQPSEIAKFAFVILAASIASGASGKSFSGLRNSQKLHPSKKLENAQTVLDPSKDIPPAPSAVLSLRRFAVILAAGGAYCGLILLEPNLSITLVLGTATFVTLFLFGAKLKHLACVAAPAVVALPVMLVAEPYRVRRLLAFIDPWANPKDEGFQLIQSLFGLGNGGFLGVGFGKSTQKHMFLPFSESDFIFSIIGEELGFLGAIFFMVNLLLIIILIYRVGSRCDERFGKYLCFGIATVLFIQSAVNLAVVTGTIPPTGVPLPFVSFGGTSLAVYMAAMGIVLNVDKHNKKRIY